MSDNFTEWLTARQSPVWGSWLMSTAAACSEAMGWAGFDFLVLDLEHVPLETSQAIEHLRALAVTPAHAVVRLPANDPVAIKRALDIGAQTLMIPFVQDADEARAAVRASFYPPRGARGVAAMHRASRYTSDSDYFASADQGISLIAQIETAAAVARLEEIAGVEGISALFVGPGDLAADLGRIGRIADPGVQQVQQDVAQRCHAVGIPCGTVAPNAELARRCLAYGYDFVAVASDLGFMVGAARAALGELRQA